MSGICYRRDIDGLRAVAVGTVVAYHVGVPGFSGGFVGVDVFFVISGFLITTLLLDELSQRGRIDLLGFYARRARRLLPAFFVVVLVTLLLGAVLLVPTASEQSRSGSVSAGRGAILFQSAFRSCHRRLFRRPIRPDPAATHLVFGGRGAVLFYLAVAAHSMCLGRALPAVEPQAGSGLSWPPSSSLH